MLNKMITWFEIHKKTSFFLLLLTWGTMIYFSSIPGNKINFGSVWPSIIYHFLIFLVFCFFLYSFLNQKKINVNLVIFSLAICLVLACLDEFYQSFIPFRSSGLFDVLIDFSGASSSMLIGLIVKNNLLKKSSLKN